MLRKLQQLQERLKKLSPQKKSKKRDDDEAVEMNALSNSDNKKPDITISHEIDGVLELLNEFVIIPPQELTISSQPSKSIAYRELPLTDNSSAILVPKQTPQELRTNYLNFLILMSVHFSKNHNQLALSNFQKLGIEILCTVISYFDFKSMQVDFEQGMQLAKVVLFNASLIQKILKDPIAQINVFHRERQFTFFHSIRILAKDRKKNNEKFSGFDAVVCWEQHSSLFKKVENKQELLDSIKGTQTYRDIVRHLQNERSLYERSL